MNSTLKGCLTPHVAVITASTAIGRIDDFHERELIEIGSAGADLPDAVLAHKNCRVSIVEQR